MTVFSHPRTKPDEDIYWYWQCDFCLKNSKPLTFSGYWDGRILAREDLDDHRRQEHGGRIWANSPVTVDSLIASKKKLMKKRKK